MDFFAGLPSRAEVQGFTMGFEKPGDPDF